MVPSLSLPKPVKLTANGAVPLVGLALAEAVGGTSILILISVTYFFYFVFGINVFFYMHDRSIDEDNFCLYNSLFVGPYFFSDINGFRVTIFFKLFQASPERLKVITQQHFLHFSKLPNVRSTLKTNDTLQPIPRILNLHPLNLLQSTHL